MKPDNSPVNFDAFLIAWNQHQGMKTPELHIEIARWLAESWQVGDRELVLLAFRNAGKSTIVGLFCSWLLMRNANLRILVLAADFALASKMVRNVKRIIERHPLTHNLKPDRADQWASAQFTVNRPRELRDPSMLAKGIGANITGSRADVVICDDVEVPNTSDTPGKRQDLRQRLDEIDYVLTPGGLQLYVGTPHTYYSIYADKPRADADEEVPYLAGFKRLELPLLDGGGNSRWPEHFPAAKINAIRLRTGPNKFASQMLLQPVNITDGRLDPERLKSYDDDLDYREANGEAKLLLGGKRMVSVSCWWDPSFGSPDKGDASVIACVFTGEDGDYRLHGVRYLEHDPALSGEVDEATQLCNQVCSFVRDHFLPSVTLETNGLGRFLPGLLRRELNIAGLPSAVIEKASSRSKDLRIIDAFDAVLAAGRLHAHRQVFSTPFITEMREWRPGTKARDDGLDAVSGCLLSEPVRLPRLPAPAAKDVKARANWRPGQGGFKADAEFKI
ncbi:MAG: phage terminase large subunit [Proteobacteria bacterium]|nr:phage terminase large subunit [Pseudomonadota bacterium]MDA1022265.1 phage terminase large subunit [Pseudomonadota bacterium]